MALLLREWIRKGLWLKVYAIKKAALVDQTWRDLIFSIGEHELSIMFIFPVAFRPIAQTEKSLTG